jgi:Zn-dependent M16 (insulinase) family peptidase
VERHLTRMTPDKLQSERTQILSVTLNELRALADMVGKVMDQGAICVVGNENKIEEQRDLFRQTLSLRR